MSRAAVNQLRESVSAEADKAIRTSYVSCSVYVLQLLFDELDQLKDEVHRLENEPRIEVVFIEAAATQKRALPVPAELPPAESPERKPVNEIVMVVRGLCDGLPTSEIASETGMKPPTIRTLAEIFAPVMDRISSLGKEEFSLAVKTVLFTVGKGKKVA